MRRHYGSWLRRLVSGGVTLTPLEAALMEGFVAGVPEEIGKPLAAQLKAINRARRSRDGTALRFDRLRGLRPDGSDLPPLPVTPGEAKLMTVEFVVPGTERTLTASFRAVGRQFCRIDFSENLRPFGDAVPRVTGVQPSWRESIVQVRAA
ncbi:MAG TPA: hypothetical protein VLW45_02470 [Pelomicrobium sp.]|nr:hypothetical protein [Pelomicrobium sp.]